MKNPPVKRPYRNNFLQTGGAKLDEGDNTKIMRVNIKLFNLEPVDLYDAAAVEGRLGEFFEIYAEADMKPTVAGMAMALGVDRRRLWEIKSGAMRGGHTPLDYPKETVVSIKKAYSIMENMWESYMNSGKINPVSGIFLGKNNFGYQDKTEYVVTPNVKQESDFNEEDIRKRYLTGPEVIDVTGEEE